MKLKLGILGLLMSTSLVVSSQQIDSTKHKEHKNIIRYNISNALLFSFDKAIIFGYERAITPKQSFSINLGTIGFPRSGKDIQITDSITVQNTSKSTGFNLAADYRFYLAKENKFHAPRGIYIGPYYAFNHFSKGEAWNYEGDGGSTIGFSTNIDFNVHTVGVEMGYQFILWKRLALDFIMVAPGVGFYDLKAGISDNSKLSMEQREKVEDVITKIINRRIPGLDYVIKEHSLQANGHFKTTSIGYRFLIHIGYSF